MSMFLTLLLLSTNEAGPYKGELAERLAKPVRAEFVSGKKSYDLELCAADVISALGHPTVLRDGPDDVIVAAASVAGQPFPGTISIKAAGTGSKLELRLLGNSWDDRMTQRLQSCL